MNNIINFDDHKSHQGMRPKAVYADEEKEFQSFEREILGLEKEIQEHEKKLKEYENKIAHFEKQSALMEGFYEASSRWMESRLSENDKILYLFEQLLWFKELKNFNPDILLEFEKAKVRFTKKTITVTEILPKNDQITLPGFEKITEEQKTSKQKINLYDFDLNRSFIKKHSGKSVRERLANHDKETLASFYKYLYIDLAWTSDTNVLADKISEYMLKHPFALLPCFTVSAIDIFLKVADLEEGKEVLIDLSQILDYRFLAVWDLLSLEIYKENDNCFFAVSIPEEVERHILPAFRLLKENGIRGEELAGYLHPEKRYRPEELYQSYDNMMDAVTEILKVYGMLPEDHLYSIFENDQNISCQKEDFLRYIYLSGSCRSFLATGKVTDREERYVGISPEHVDWILENERTEIAEYAPFSECRQALKRSIDLWNPLIHKLAEWDDAEEILSEAVFRCRLAGFEGAGIYEALDLLKGYFNMDNVIDEAALFRVLLIAFLHVPCYILKGYTIEQASEKFGLDKYELLLQEEKQDSETDIKIEKLPVELQKLLVDMILLSQEGKYKELLQAEKGITGKFRKNSAVGALMAMNRVAAWQNTSKVKKNFLIEDVQEFLDTWSKGAKEENIISLMEWCDSEGFPVFDDSDFYIRYLRSCPEPIAEEEMFQEFPAPNLIQMPVIKEEKIYPNDPCPCGSGKKYKKCCGRKK